MWPFSFNTVFHRYKILEIYEGGKTPEKKFSGVKFQISPTDSHTWGCLVFVLEDPLQGGLSGLPKWEPRARYRVYLGHYPFHAGSVALLLNTRTGNISSQYHVVFENTFFTVEHIRKGKVPGNWKNLV